MKLEASACIWELHFNNLVIDMLLAHHRRISAHDSYLTIVTSGLSSYNLLLHVARVLLLVWLICRGAVVGIGSELAVCSSTLANSARLRRL